MDNTYTYDINEERLRRQSLSGSTGQRTREKKVKINWEKFKKFLAVYSAVVVFATSTVIGLGSRMVGNIKNNIMVNEMAYDFRVDYISPETHRTLDNEHYYYDYGDIADHIYETGDFDTGLYLFYLNTNEYQTGRVLNTTEYKTLENYLQARNYESVEEWSKDMRERIILTDAINDKQKELDQMNNEHNMNDTTDTTYGGK